MKAEIKVPAVGESITEATIAEWTKTSGDYVARDEIILVLETDKASVEVVAEQDGVLTTSAEEGDTVEIGAVVGSIDTDAAKPAGAAASPAPTETPAQQPAPAQAHPDLQKIVPPAANKIVQENNLDANQIQGSGRGGRITKADAMASANAPAAQNTQVATTTPPLPQAISMGGNEERREKMSRLRQTIAKRLVESQQTAATLTTFNEIDMTNVIALRKKYKDSFEKRYGIRLGFMGFFVKAAVEALKDFPAVNASIDGVEMIFRNFFNIGMAVGTPKGLVVPVIRNSEMLTIAQVEMAIKHYGTKAKDGKISMDDLSGGTFTISNGGVYGSLMSTPILNPPQSGILGLHKIEERPIAVDGKVEIRPMMYVALSYDHRIIDGSESVQFLVKIKESIEDPSRMLLEI